MEIIEVKCANCSKKVYIQEDSYREFLFCTLGCLDQYNNSSLKGNNIQ